jgi:hypothetical protein
MKTTYEIACIEEDRIFIVPNLSEKTIIESSATLSSFYNHVSKNWGCKLQIIFGFRKFSFSEGLEYEWKAVVSKRWRAIYFAKYQGEVPRQSEITGFPSSSLFDL